MRRLTLIGLLVVCLSALACGSTNVTCHDNGSCGGSATGGAGGTTNADAGASGGTGGTGANSGGTSASGAGGSAPCKGACKSPTPACNTTTNTCVECVGATDCATPKPACDKTTNTCVECTANTDCSGTKKLCDTTAQACVQCLSNTDCTDAAASRCDAGVCKPCTASADCSKIAGKTVCDTSATSAKCVQCTATEATSCSGNPCNPVTDICSAFGTNRQTCQSCDTDANCAAAGANYYCVPMKYNGVDRPGGYCLKDSATGCARPFSSATPVRTTLSGVTGKTFCDINEALATCEAVRALVNDAKGCPGGKDSECPESGLCRTVGALSNLCTYPCAAGTDCPSSGASSTCGGGSPSTTPTYCGG